MAFLSLRLLGQFQGTLDGQPVTLWRYDKVRALLAYLAIEADHPHRRDALAALLWPDSDYAAGRKSLRQALTSLRAAIGDEEAHPPFLLVTRETIQFNAASGYELDVTQFLALVTAVTKHAHQELAHCPACLERLGQAAALYQGDLLPGFFLPDNIVFEEWLLATRERLRLQAIDVLGHLAVAQEERGDEETAVQAARRQLTLDPWNEEASRLLMRVLARRGHRTAALAEYERCRRILAADLGITPSQETVATYEQIRAETGVELLSPRPARPAAPTGAALPVPLSPLLGREDEMIALLDLLQRGDVRLLTLLGAPGIGKTRLALQVAHTLQDLYQGMVFFVPLAAVQDPDLVPSAISHALGIAERGSQPLLAAVAQHFQERPALLVLDNFEQVREAATAVLTLLQNCPSLKILVTSRAPLRLRGEHQFLLSPLLLPPLPALPALGALAQNPTVALFTGCAQAVDATFALTAENAAAVATICVRLDGLPLAIELAASRVKLISPALLLKRLESTSSAALHLLKDNVRDHAAHHQTLHNAIQWSYNLLPAALQTLFARLSIFVSGFTLEAAEAVCSGGDFSINVEEGVAALLDHSLLKRSQDAGDAYRFTMLQTIRQFAQERLAEGAEANPLQQAYADYFLSLAKLVAAHIPGHDQAIWLAKIEQEEEELRAALEWSIASAPGQGLELATALFPYWHIHSFLREGRYWLDRTLAGAPQKTATRVRALAAAALLAQRQGDFSQAEALAVTAVALGRELGERRGLAYALNNRGIVALSKGDNVLARQLAEESLLLCQEDAYPLGVNRALMIIGQVALHEGRLAEAQQALEPSLAFWRQVGDHKNTVLCLVNLGRTAMTQGRDEAAEALVEEARALSRQSGDRHWEMLAQWTLGELALRQRRLQEAQQLWTGCLAQTRELGDRYFETLTLSKLGLLALYKEEIAEAENLLRTGLAIAREIGSAWCTADLLCNQGLVALGQKDAPRAWEYLTESVRLFHQQGDHADTVQSLERLSQAALACGHADQAARLLGFCAAWRAARGEPLPLHIQHDLERVVAEAQMALGQDTYHQALAAGERLTLDQVVTIILKG